MVLRYDEAGSIQGNDAPVGHDNDNYSASLVVGRANLTSVKRYNVTDSSQFTISSSNYNTAGAMVSSNDALNHQISLSYADSFSDANNGRNTLAYPTTITDADGYSSTATYNFDFGSQTRVQGPPPANQSQGLIQNFAYDNAARLNRMTIANNGAYVRYDYGPTYAQRYSSVNNVADEAYSFQIFDGVGRTIMSGGSHPGSAGGYSAQATVYDAMGRAVRQSNPTETSGSGGQWQASGDDSPQNGGNDWVYTQQTYDWKGRPRIRTNTDTTTKEASYSGCGCAGGEVVTLTDEVTIDGGVPKRRGQKIYSDVLGRTVKTEVLNWQGGSVYATTVNTYNARDQLTLVRQFQGAAPSDL
ncbi:MAG: hypothetical protein ABR501_01895, partial [Pyrinomonadaceae bacterium]